MDSYLVSIVKDDNVERQVRKAIELIGGMNQYVKPGCRVLMKPNMTGPAPYTKGVTTNPAVLDALMKLAWEAGAARVDVGDGTGSIHIGSIEVMERCGIGEVARKNRGEMVDLNLGETVDVPVINGFILESVKVNKKYFDYDVVVNIPVLKTHFITEVSLGIKNMKGCIPPVEKRRFHDIGVNKAVADLGAVIAAGLTVMDGTVAGEGLGPKEGRPVNFKTVLAGGNTLAVDMVSAEIMGFEPMEIEHIHLAAKHHIGPSEPSQIQIQGESIANIKRKFQRAVPSVPPGENAQVLNYQACSGCMGCAAITISRLHDMGFFEKVPDIHMKLIIGTKVPDENFGENAFLIGNCTKSPARRNGNVPWIAGCAPSALDTANEILSYYGLDEHPDV